ncbi:MAG: hypothetical protein ABSC94_01515 [Polyangiaceae bacterium]
MAQQRTAGSPADSRPLPIRPRNPAVERTRHAVDLSLRCLDGIRKTDDVRHLVDRAEQLRTEIEQWSLRPPSSEKREAVMRGALSIQLAALALHRTGS